MTELYWAIIPFIVIMLITLIIVTYVPSLTPIKAKKAEPTEVMKAPAASEARDAGVKVSIQLPDGGLITEDYCEKAEIKGDALAYADCQTMFKLWPRCDPLQPLDKLECQQKVLDGEDPFEAVDAGQ